MAHQNDNLEYRSYDIISQYNPKLASKTFIVAFDYFTPRPHFVCLPKIYGRWKQLSELKGAERQDLLQLATATTTALGLRKSVLSFHLGKWLTTKDTFHSHICTDVDPYLEIFRNLSQRPPMNGWWPSRQFVNKQWRVAKDPTRYDENVRRYPQADYKQEEIGAIRHMNAGQLGHGLPRFDGVDLVYHGCQRRIGLASPWNASDLLNKLEALAKHLQVERGHEGSHICIDLTGNGFGGFERPVYGYLEVSGPVFYKSSPAGQRAQWLSNFASSNTDGKVYT